MQLRNGLGEALERVSKLLGSYSEIAAQAVILKRRRMCSENGVKEGCGRRPSVTSQSIVKAPKRSSLSDLALHYSTQIQNLYQQVMNSTHSASAKEENLKHLIEKATRIYITLAPGVGNQSLCLHSLGCQLVDMTQVYVSLLGDHAERRCQIFMKECACRDVAYLLQEIAAEAIHNIKSVVELLPSRFKHQIVCTNLISPLITHCVKALDSNESHKPLEVAISSVKTRSVATRIIQQLCGITSSTIPLCATSMQSVMETLKSVGEHDVREYIHDQDEKIKEILQIGRAFERVEVYERADHEGNEKLVVSDNTVRGYLYAVLQHLVVVQQETAKLGIAQCGLVVKSLLESVIQQLDGPPFTTQKKLEREFLIYVLTVGGDTPPQLQPHFLGVYNATSLSVLCIAATISGK